MEFDAVKTLIDQFIKEGKDASDIADRLSSLDLNEFLEQALVYLHEKYSKENNGCTLPEIKCNDRQLRDKTQDCENILYESEKNNPSLFQRGGCIVRIIRDEKGNPHIEPVDYVTLKNILSRLANFVNIHDTKTGIKTSDTSLPKEVVEDFLALKNWKLPALLGISETPIFHKDGQVITKLGYDTETQLFYCPDSSIQLPAIPVTPIRQDIDNARALLLDPYADFPFVDDASRENVIGLLLAIIARTLIEGCIPMLIIDKPQAGTGATLCVDATNMIATGRTASMDSIPADDDELRKLISTKLISGSSLMVLDNLEGLLRSTALSILLTASQWHARILGSLNEVDISIKLVTVGTGNNVTLAGDLHRRCIFSYMDAQEARPWMSDKQYKHENLLQWVKDNRGSLLAAGITLIKAWLQAGSPKPKNVPKLGRFESFRDVIGGVMEYAGFTHFLGNLIETYEKSDVEIPQWERFLETWQTLLGSGSITISDLIGKLRENSDFKSALPDSLNELESKNASRVIGNRIAKRDNNRFPNGLMLKRDGEYRKSVKWKVESYKNLTLTKLDSNESYESYESIQSAGKINNTSNISVGQETNSHNTHLDSKQCELPVDNSHSYANIENLPDKCPVCGSTEFSPKGEGYVCRLCNKIGED